MVTSPVKFVLSCTSDRLWNSNEFVEFLSRNQGGNIVLSTDPEAVCLNTLGVYQLLQNFSFESVKIQTWNPLEHHPDYTISFNGKNFWFDRTIEIPEHQHDWNLKHVFLCFYHRPTAARLALAGYAENLDSLIHFSARVEPDYRHHYELDKLFHWDLDSVVRSAGMLTRLPMLQSSPDNLTAFHGYDYMDPLTDMYKNVLVDLVVESHVIGNTFFPTEKTIRPMLMKKPFVMFGSRDYLEYLRQMGFRTFSDFWPEDYDGYEAGDRLRKIYQTINHIASLSKDQLQTMWWDMKYSLDHNYNLLLEKKFQRKIIPI